MLIKQSPASELHASVLPKADLRFWKLTIGCVGVVYGDIGTSPLYALKAAVQAASEGHVAGQAEIYGVLSLIIWALMVIVTLKYVLLLLRADNRGEGGILSLTALAQKAIGKNTGFVVLMGLVGASLFYGDAAITPAISVLSAVEGLKLATPAFNNVVLPLSILILVALFSVQKGGTGRVSTYFGPITVIWFLAIGLTGAVYIAKYPGILWTVNPLYGAGFLLHHGSIGLAVLGAVFLAVTGAEALYADLGHFGRKPIQTAWLFLVFPCLLLNYLGQGALLLENPAAIENPFYLLAPRWALLPMVGLATAATIIASQAVITGAYSLTQQAVQLGFLPRFEIRHTSDEHEGQIFMPKVNRLLMLGVVFLCLVFRSSDALANAYGIAVTGTMITTSLLAFLVIWKDWGRTPMVAAILMVPFVVIEGIFLAANMLKVFEGGVVPLLFAGFLILLMTIWVRGTRYLSVHARRQAITLGELVQTLDAEPPIRVPGTAIFLTGDSQSTPVAMVQNLKHNKVMHERNVIVTVVTNRIPRVPDSQRAVVEKLAPYMTCVILHYGYMETPDVPRALALATGLDLDLRDVSYFLGHRTLISDARRGLPEWQDHIFIPMAMAAANATDFFRLPPGKVVELGVQVVI